MPKDQKPLREALNLRIDETLGAEIDRIAALQGKSPSEVGRLLLSYGAEVERRLEAQRLMRHYDGQFSSEVAGRIVIQAEFVPYTWQEVAQRQQDFDLGNMNRLPTWDDLAP